jgi:hypothetical protein
LNIPKVGVSPYVQPRPKQSFEEAQEPLTQKRTEQLKSPGITQYGQTQPKQSPQAVEEASKTSEGPERPKAENPSRKRINILVE